MLRSIAVLLLIAVAVGARSAPPRTTIATTTKEPAEESTYMAVPAGTITVDVDSDVILTTSPEGESFTEASPMELTEEPLPDSVLQQLERERAEEERARNPEAPESETEAETEPEPATTTQQPTTTKRTNTFKFGATTLPPGFAPTLWGLTTQKPPDFTTENFRSEDTTDYAEARTSRNYFGHRPSKLEKGDLEMAENRMETTTDAPVQDVTFPPAAVELSMAMTTDATLVEENPPPRGEAEPEESVSRTESPLFRFFSTSPKVPESTEALPEPTTVLPVAKEEEATIVPAVEESTEVPLPSPTQAPESITEAPETTTVPAPSTTMATEPAPSTTMATEPAPLTARIELYLNAQPESTSTTSVPETTTTTESAPETTTTTMSAPETTTSTTSAPETTTSTTSAPETTTSTTSAPETTVPIYYAPEPTSSTTSAPETTTSTTSAPETTTSTTSAPETTTSTTSSTTSTTSTTPAPTTTTTTARPVLTRAPRVERIFNSDGVEVLYGYSSVVRTNRS